MNWYLIAATLLSVLNAGLHFFLGGKSIARPLLEVRALGDEVRCILYFCWHITTITLVLLAIVFGVAVAAPSQISLAIVGTGAATAIAVLGVAAPPALKVSYKDTPQGFLFIPVALLGMLGLF